MRVYSIRLGSQDCGPSTFEFNDERTEIFLAGCSKAMNGNPCKGCFNKDLWDILNGVRQKPQEIVDYILSNTNNKYVTIVGGEPVDQIDGLIKLCELLKKNKFHIVLFSHYLKEDLLTKYPTLFYYIDILIDGEYIQSQRIFDTDPRAGVRHVIGSANQRIWYIQRTYYFHSKPEILSIVYRNVTDATEAELRKYYREGS